MLFKVESKAEILAKNIHIHDKRVPFFMVTSKSEQWLKIKCHPGSTKTTFPASEGVMDTLQSSTTNYGASTFSRPLLTLSPFSLT